MLVLKNKGFEQMGLAESFLPKSIITLTGELAKVDEFLSDERLIKPFEEHFRTTCGRPSTPVDVYLRMMYIKKRYNLGYELLCKEVGDSISWRIFCHIGLEGKVVDFTTLSKLTRKYGEKTLEELNALIIQKARKDKLTRTRKVRTDTTVIEADIHYPTDAGLLADGVRVINRIAKRIRETDNILKVKWQDHTRSVKKRLLSIVKFGRARTKQAKALTMEKVKEILEITRKVISSATRFSATVKRKIKKRKKTDTIKRFICKLDETIAVVRKVAHQTEQVISGITSIPNRIVSIFDQGARPIKRGKARSDPEFGRKVALTESEEKLIVSYKVLEGNPSDKTLAVPMIEKTKEILGKAPEEASFDRGFSSTINETKIQELGVKRVAIPKPGKKSTKRKEFEQQYWFKKLKRWRSGGEATIGLLKRKYGLERCLFNGTSGTAIWVGLAIFAHNIDKLIAMTN